MENNHTRLTLAPAYINALTHIAAARAELKKLLVSLNEEERIGLPPVPAEMPTLTASITEAAASHPTLLAVCQDYDPVMIRDRVEQAIQIAAVLNEVEAFARELGDTRNAWLAQAYRSLLSLYEIAKPLADRNSVFMPVVRPLANLFSSRQTSPKSKSKSKSTTTAGTPPTTESKPKPE